MDLVIKITFPEAYVDRIINAFQNLSQTENNVMGRYGSYVLQFPKKNGQSSEDYVKECISLATKAMVDFSEQSTEKYRYSQDIKAVKPPEINELPIDILRVE